jgi:uncharacterized protein (TIGR03083 family)
MPTDPHAEAALRHLRTESDGWLAELAALAPDDWERPTNCAPWTVRVLVAHPVNSAAWYLDSIEAGLGGTLLELPSGEARAQRMHAIAAREPATILADFRAATDRVERTLSGRPSADFDRLATHGYGPRTIRWFVDQRLAEIAFHRWDMAHSLGRPADLAPGTAAHLLPMLLEQNLPVSMGPNYPRGSGTFRLAVSADPTAAWTLAARPGSLTVTRDAVSPPDVILTADAAALALLVYGRRAIPELEQAGRLTIEGDRELAARFHEIFKGP